MWDFIIQRELNKTIIDTNNKKITKSEAVKKLDKLAIMTRENVKKGQKRELKNNIFQTKKTFKL